MTSKRYVVYQVVWNRHSVHYNGVPAEFDNEPDAMAHINSTKPIGQFVLVDFGPSSTSNMPGKAIYI